MGLAALTLALLAVVAAPPELEVDVLAREIAPGEPLRIVARGRDGDARIQGTLGADRLAFTRFEGDGPPLWSAWAAIDLDRRPGPLLLRVEVRDRDGATRTASRYLDVAAKEFPEQRLTVERKFVTPPKSAAARIERERKKLAAIYATRSSVSPPAAPFVRPVPGKPTGVFGARRFFNGEPRQPHPGIDLEARTGSPVVAAGPGRVALAEDLYYSGRTVILDHGGGLFTVYAHLSSIEVKPGAAVAAGDRLGKSGATGRVTGPHLHWGAKIAERIFDPRALLDERLFER